MFGSILVSSVPKKKLFKNLVNISRAFKTRRGLEGDIN